MRITHIVLLGLLVGAGLPLAACDTIDNLTNMLDTKKRLPGDRRPVFPDGVPGVEMGVPPEMMKGYQEKQAAGQAQTPPGTQTPAGQAPPGQAAQTEQPETPKPKKVVTRPKPKPAPSDTAQQASAPPAQGAQAQTAAWPSQPAQAAPAQAAPAPWPGQQTQPQQQQQQATPAWPTSR
jgi:hypothetical protein